MSTLVEQKVAIQLSKRILPPILAANSAAPRHMVIADRLHFYTTEIVSVVLGWGLFRSPLLELIAGREDAAWSGESATSVGLAIAWTAFLLWFKNGKISERLAKQDACKRTFRAFDDQMHKILRSDTHPVHELRDLTFRVEEAFEHHRDGFVLEPNSDEIRAAAKARASELVAEFRDGWEEVLRGPGEHEAQPAERPDNDEARG